MAHDEKRIKGPDGLILLCFNSLFLGEIALEESWTSDLMDILIKFSSSGLLYLRSAYSRISLLSLHSVWYSFVDTTGLQSVRIVDFWTLLINSPFRTNTMSYICSSGVPPRRAL